MMGRLVRRFSAKLAGYIPRESAEEQKAPDDLVLGERDRGTQRRTWLAVIKD